VVNAGASKDRPWTPERVASLASNARAVLKTARQLSESARDAGASSVELAAVALVQKRSPAHDRQPIG